MKKSKYKIAFIESSPNWHRPELYEKISAYSRIELMVYFCSKGALNGQLLSKTFDVKNRHLDEDLLKGYKYKFLKNYSLLAPRFMKTRLCSHLNFDVWRELKRGGYDAVVIFMWNDITYWLAAIACKFYGIPILLFGDSTVLTERDKPEYLLKIKRLVLGKILFPMATYLLYTGELSRQFYLSYKVPKERLCFYPQSVDCERYFKSYANQRGRRKHLRVEHGISNDALVILFVGRLSEEKNLFDLVEAFQKVQDKRKILLIVGEGKLRPVLEERIAHEAIGTVCLAGFKQKRELVKLYGISDILVLPSKKEAHSAVVKEAMCFGLPIIVSDKVGVAGELVKHNENGFVYPCGDTDQLARYIDELSNEAKRERMGQKSLEIVKHWDHKKAIANLVNALDKL